MTVIDQLKHGMHVLKFTRGGLFSKISVKDHTLHLDPEENLITWDSHMRGSGDRGIDVRMITAIPAGATTETLIKGGNPHDDRLYYSIIMPDRTFDFKAISEHHRDRMVRVLKRLCKSKGHSV